MMKYCESCLTKAFNQHSPRSSIRINKMLKRLSELQIKNLCTNKMMTNSKKIKELTNKSKNHKPKLLTWFSQFALTYIHEGTNSSALLIDSSHIYTEFYRAYQGTRKPHTHQLFLSLSLPNALFFTPDAAV